MYPAGIPLLFFLALFLNRELLFEDPALIETKERLESEVFELHAEELALQDAGNCARNTVKAEVIREELCEKEGQLERVEHELFHAEKMRGRLGFLYRYLLDR